MAEKERLDPGNLPPKGTDWTIGYVRDGETGEELTINLPGNAGKDEIKRTFIELRAVRDNVSGWFVDSLEKAIDDTPEYIAGPVAAFVSARLLGVYSEVVQLEIEKNNRDAFEQTRLVRIEDDTAEFDARLVNEVIEELEEAPPEWLTNVLVSSILPQYRENTDLGEWMATHIVYWARRDMQKEMGSDFEALDGDTFGEKLEEHIYSGDGRYFREALEIIANELADIVWGALEEVKHLEEATPLKIEKLLGLHPTSGKDGRPETPEMARDPFQGNAGQIAAIPSGPFAMGATRALIQARETPGETFKGAWGMDSGGHPVYVQALGNPYDGKAIYTVRGIGDAKPADMDAGLGWAMLKKIDPDAVWTHLLLLAHAADPGRRGERSVIRVPRHRIERALGLNRSKAHTAAERYEKAKKTINALGSIFVRFQNVHRHGDQLHFSGGSTPSPLWNLSLETYGQVDMFDGGGRANWHLEATEGLWADKFLHENDSPQWTWLPVEWFDKIDRRRSDWAQRLAAYLLFLFRADAKTGHRVDLTAKTMLEICNIDLTRERASSQRTGLKNKLLGALETLSEAYGIGVDARDVDVKYIPWGDWKGRVAYFDPPEVIEGNLFQGKNPKARRRELMEPGGDWTSSQIRALRKRLGMTQEELGRKFGVGRSYICKLENQTRTPSRQIRKGLDKLAARLDAR